MPRKKKEHALKSLNKSIPSFEKKFMPLLNKLMCCSKRSEDMHASDIWCFASIPILQHKNADWAQNIFDSVLNSVVRVHLYENVIDRV